MSAADAVAFLDGYRRHFAPPVRTGVTVESVRRTADGFDVHTDDGHWSCDAVVAASGGLEQPRVPALAADMPRAVEQLTALRVPAAGPGLRTPGAVLVVGASASGVQIADELRSRRSRRHDRRRRARAVAAFLSRTRHLLVARPDRPTRRALRRSRRHRPRPPARVCATRRERRATRPRRQRASAIVVYASSVGSWRCQGTTGQCSGALANLAKNADLKQARLLRRIDEYRRASTD